MVHPLFRIYTRSYLSETTGFSKSHLCRVATGKAPLTRSFVARVCLALGEPAEKLFLPGAVEAGSPPKVQVQQ